MRLVDTNLLVYAHVKTFAQHAAAQKWLDLLLNGAEPLGLPWPSLLGFVRLVANPRVFENPEPVSQAWQQVEDWLRSPSVWIPAPTERHAEILGGLLRSHNLHANHVPDAHLAALAIEHGLVLCSTDGDFAHFRGVRWVNPLS